MRITEDILRYATSSIQPFVAAPKKTIIATIAFAAIKCSIDHFLPNHQTFSFCAGMLPALALGDLSTQGTLILAWAGIVSYNFPTVPLVASIGAEFLCSAVLGFCTTDFAVTGRRKTAFEITAVFTLIGAGFGVITRCFYGPHALATHINLFAISTFAVNLIGIAGYKAKTLTTISLTVLPVYAIALASSYVDKSTQSIGFFTIAALIANTLILKIEFERNPQDVD